jgi:Tol biopolymer transport system component
VLAVALAMAVSGCGDGDNDSVPAESATSSTTPAPARSSTTPAPSSEFVGRLMFSRFEESTHTFLSTHIATADGSNEREISLPGPEGGGRWSRDGAHIAVMTLVEDERVGTAIVAPDGNVERVLDLPDATLNLVCTVWSPDDSRLACEGFDDTDPKRNGIYTVSSTDGSDVQRLTTAVEEMTDFPGDFSPDGDQFIFLRAAGEGGGQLMIVDIAGGEPRTLSSEPSYEDSGRFSADGSSILTSARGTILVVGLDGEVVSEIVEDGAFLFGPVWSPDGDLIAFSRTTSGFRADIFISRPDGDERAQITETPDNEIVVEWGAEP